MTVDRADLGRVLVLIPAYNEQACIVTTIAEVRVAVPNADVLVIDDASSDETARLATHAGADVLTLADNCGAGGAMREGYRYAAAEGYDVAVRVDADGQHDAHHIAHLLARLGQGADLVVGSRFSGTASYAVGLGRRWAIGRLSHQITWLTGTSFSDPTSGFRATGRRAIELYAEESDLRFLGDTIDALLTAVARGLTVAEVPVRMRARQGGRPSMGLVTSAVGFLRTTRSLDRAPEFGSSQQQQQTNPISILR